MIISDQYSRFRRVPWAFISVRLRFPNSLFFLGFLEGTASNLPKAGVASRIPAGGRLECRNGIGIEVDVHAISVRFARFLSRPKRNHAIRFRFRLKSWCSVQYTDIFGLCIQENPKKTLG